MALKYTTVEAIARRLQTRLKLSGPQTPFGTTVVDEDLVDQVAAQIEARVDGVIQANSPIMPFQAAAKAIAKPVLAAVVEKGCVCEIGATHFAATEEGNSYAREQCRQYEAALVNLGQDVARLPGNQRKPTPDKPAYSYSGVASRTIGPAEEIKF